MKLDRLFRDVYSKLNLTGDKHQIYAKDIINTLNDSIRSMRAEYVRLGFGSEFAVTETLDELFNDEFPLKWAQLENSVIDEIPIEMSILNSMNYLYSDELADEVASFSKGDIVVKDGFYYEAISDIDSINTYDLTFSKSNVRSYKLNNGLKYYEGDIIYSDTYYRVTQDFTAEEDNEEIEQLYWVKRGIPYISPVHYPFGKLRNLHFFGDIKDFSFISIKGDRVYVPRNIVKVVVSYIPKWEEVTDLEQDISIPDFMVANIVGETVNRLRAKVFGTFEKTRELEQREEEENE